jgi:hypothetical protein
MILRELFYFRAEDQDPSKNFRFDPARDVEELQRSDTRKTRLTLKQINYLRKSSEAHILEMEKDLEFVNKMYGVAAEQPAA